MIEENVILVNEQDEQIGLMPKLEAHEKAVLHRAFGFIFSKNEIMLQQRRIINIILLCCGPTLCCHPRRWK
jgi:isopentenyldiphosphate isomerase